MGGTLLQATANWLEFFNYYENWNDLDEKALQKRKEFHPQITQEIDVLAPESQFVEFVGRFPLLYHAMNPHTVSGELHYTDTEGHRYAQTFEINLDVIGKGYVVSKASQFVNDNDLLAKFLTESLQPMFNTAIRVCETLRRKLK